MDYYCKEDLYWLWLSINNEISYKTKKILLTRFKNTEEIWRADTAQLKEKAFLDAVSITSILNRKYRDTAQRIHEITLKKSIILLHPDQALYPEGLKTINDYPLILYCKGKPKEGEKAISIIGSRKASTYGLSVAGVLSKQLAALGITIVSGLAKGVDSAAHQGAISVGGRTVAVLGCGIDIVYPSENAALMEKITEDGMVITEFPLGTLPFDYNFPIRNRLISGYSMGIVVVEACEKSGTMITVEQAYSQGRTVFAVPGSIFSSNSKGTNKLLYDGAVVVTGIADILEDLNLVNTNDKSDNTQNNIENIRKMLPGDKYFKVYEAVSEGTSHIDGICRATGYTADSAGKLLVELELLGYLVRHGGLYICNNKQ